MNIWIDGYEANVLQRLGSSQVAFELLKGLEKIDRKNNYTILLPSEPLPDLPKERPGWDYKIIKFSKLWTWIGLPLSLYLTRNKPDLFFSPTHYIPRFSPVKTVVTIFDLSYLHFPDMFKKSDLWKLIHWSEFSIKNSRHIITISNSSKRDIIKNYGIKKEKITVAYPGFDSDNFHPISNVQQINVLKTKYAVGGEYIIYVGTIQPRKNLVRLFDAFKQVVNSPHDKTLSNLKLLVVGKTQEFGRSGWMFDNILKTPQKIGIADKVIFTGFLETSELVLLLNGAKAFVLVSLWEGFGIPVVDSMACGVPVIVSNTSSLPEVVGNAGLLVDPMSEDQIAQAIRTIVTDEKIWRKKSKEVLLRSKKFSWKSMAREVLDIFEKKV